ncbi:BRCA2-interacting transcriptional repressor EMSY isoform X1 [Parasteatoda tepidariorum]|uniref:BRCA2-interacting transcriptional repressor EMSY isoform X1 n=1 Tax=Parasteatoda tepidariorum TaxID=114398 RepID=UPI00077FA030|nr:BRCA2-interacting transcriptional repressor EMSY isoform X1 [Parasteatoda tepidariorum]XP_015914508.1 BRCA2-interacting transcriptional repressor EMSY isoform X1 [Parasteatoda tepidariorum]
MWPMIVDYTDDECKRLLRSLELEAYAAIINAFRAQGFLTKDKRKILQELCNVLSISMERHRAEIRRAVNDEHLNTVAERLYGANTSAEWSIEGRRVVPLMQRLAPQTVFTDIANSAANAQATKNASLPLPGRTGLREISNGIETMASRKRKDLPPDPSIPPNKLQAIECQYPHVQAFDSPDFQSMETSPCSETPTAEIHPATGNEISPEPTSLSDYISSKIPPMAHVPSLVSPVKSSTKHIMLKSSTVTTFSTFDQMPSNLLSSKPPSRSPLQSVSHEGHQASMAEMVKSLEPKSLQRSSSTGAMRTTVIPHTVPSTGSTSSSDRTTSSTPSQSKFVSQLRSKPAVQGRQNLPSGLGVKLNIQPPQVNPRAVSPKSSSSKGKQDSNSGFLAKKPTSGVFPPTSQSDSPAQFTVNESLTVTKTSVQKSPSPKTESHSMSSHQPASKVPVTKALPKVSTSSSQYISRSLFGGGTKGAKSLPPVIFNVSSSATLQTPTKTTGPVQSEAGKGSSSQMLSKSTPIGVGQSHMKLGSSTTQTIQYRNDGGLVRSARIINVTPPAGSRLPCSITPSAISALGLSSNLTTGALRVTLPAGTLNTSSSMRASAVAKPNVIVVHKAQMWPRSQAAVIMSSTPVQRIPESNSENAQKQEKNKLPSSSPQTATTTTVATKPQAKPLPSQSLNVSTVPIKGADTNTVRTPSPSPVQQTDSTSKEVPVPTNKNTPITQVSTKNQTSSLGSKNQITVGSKGQLSEIQCKKNLLADVIQESGLVLESTEKSLKEKGDLAKKDKEQPSKNTTTPGETLIKTVIDSTPISKTVTSIIKTIDTSSEVASLSDIRDSNILKRFEKGDDTMDSQETVITISTMEIPTKNTIKKSTDDSKEKNS